MQTHLGICFREREYHATLAQRAVFVVVKLHQGLLIRSQAIKGSKECHLLLLGEVSQLLLWYIGQSLRVAKIEEMEMFLSPPDCRECLVSGDTVEPGREGTAPAKGG